MSEDDELGIQYECDCCDLRFYVVANNDAWIASGEPFVKFCPRCGEELEIPHHITTLLKG